MAAAGVVMATKTFKAVELVKVGRWSASTGVTDVTREDLDAIVSAYADPQVDRPAIKFGHTDQRFADKEGDGEPAYGWVENPRVADDGVTLVGDLVGVPAKLAEIIPTAFRRRSVEIAWKLKTAAGKTHRAALTGLALLGTAKPAVKGMADVLALYAAGDKPAEGVTAVEQVDGVGPAELATLAAARAEVATFAAAHQVPEQTLVEALARIDRLSGANDTATVPPPSSESSDGDGNAGTTTQEEHPMLTEDRLRELLELEADANVEDAIKALKAGGTGDDKPDADKPGEGASTDKPAGDKPEGDKPADAPATEGAPALATLSAGQLQQLQAQAAAGQTALDELAKQRRDGILMTALREGRLTVAESKDWRAQLDKDEAGTVSLLSTLTPGRVGTVEVGTDADVAALTAGGPNEAAFAAEHERMFGSKIGDN